MTKEERKAKFVERQRLAQQANDTARNYVPPQPKTRKVRTKRVEPLPNESGFLDRFGIGDNLGESPDY